MAHKDLATAREEYQRHHANALAIYHAAEGLNDDLADYHARVGFTVADAKRDRKKIAAMKTDPVQEVVKVSAPEPLVMSVDFEVLYGPTGITGIMMDADRTEDSRKGGR